MPPRLRSRAKTVATATVSATPRDGVIDPETLTALAAAAAKGERVRFGYADRHGRTTTRHVEPVRLVALSRHWYLVALDLDRMDWRTFRVDRIAEPHATGGRADIASSPAAMCTPIWPRPGPPWHPSYTGDIILNLSLTDAETRLRDSIGDGRIEGLGARPHPVAHARRHRAMARLTDPAPGLRVRSLRTARAVQIPPRTRRPDRARRLEVMSLT